MVQIKCPTCNSDAYLSRRRGLREGILLRFMLYAVFRCSHCSRRWPEYMPAVAFRKTRRSETASEYIGWGDAKGQEKLTRVVLIAVAVLIMTVAFLNLKRQTVRVRLNEQGKQIAEPKPNKLAPVRR